MLHNLKRCSNGIHITKACPDVSRDGNDAGSETMGTCGESRESQENRENIPWKNEAGVMTMLGAYTQRRRPTYVDKRFDHNINDTENNFDNENNFGFFFRRVLQTFHFY